MADLSGRTVGGFRIEREFLKGAQGRVYEAVCETDSFPGCPAGTRVALKTMPSHDDTDESFRRLSRRTGLLVALNHPNVVRYFGCFRIQEPFGELHAVVMELLHGETLKARLAREPCGLDADMAVRIAEGMILGLGAASAAGLCHRDVKPGNVFLCGDGGVKLIDFEAARVDGGSLAASELLAGSFDYMAPEFTDSSFFGDERSDVFSAGVVVHEMLTGVLPYRKNATGNTQTGVQSADFAFQERWARGPDGGFANSPVAVSVRIRRLIAHSERLLSGSLAPERAERFRGFADMLEAMKAVRFRELKSGASTYRILQLVGKGGFGEVFKARLRKTGKIVAIKHLLDSDYADRFYREAKIMAQLDDPCFVKFIDFMVVNRSENRDAFLVMDFLPGMPGNSLKDAIKRSPGGLPRDDVLAAFVRYARGLKVLHSRGIYHRDIKPANLYYPDGQPGKSAIMDLGIARNVHGTVTTGNVPGTFDYMAPEVVVEGSRGESGTDIYALGLCLYEALSGRTGYPRLPKGYAAYAQFFTRAKRREKPVFDSPAVAGDLRLLALLDEMTEPDLSRRLVSAAEVERRIASIAAGAAAPALAADEPATSTVTVTVTATHGTSSEPPHRRDRIGMREMITRIRRPLLKIARGAVAPAILAAVGVCAWFYGPAAVELAQDGARAAAGWYGRMVEGIEDRKAAKLAVERTALAASAADTVIGRYADASFRVEDSDSWRAEWRKKWQGEIPEDEMVRIDGLMETARKRRMDADRGRIARETAMQTMVSEAADVERAYGMGDVERGDAMRDAWIRKWRRGQFPTVAESIVGDMDGSRARAKAAISERESVKAAEAAAVPVGKAYAADGKDVGDRMRTVWDRDWKDRIPKAEYAKITGKLDRLRKAAVKREFDSSLAERREQTLAECRELCGAVEPVESRASRIDEAERRIRAAYKDGIVDDRILGDFLADVRRLRSTVVVRIVNRSDRDVSVGCTPVPNGEHRVFSFTNGIPGGLAVICRGYRPMPIRDWMNGRTLSLTPDDFEVERVDVTVPDAGSDVVCRIDGAPVLPGDAKLMPGSHECSYSRKGFRTQTFPFLVEIASPMQLPRPGQWIDQ